MEDGALAVPPGNLSFVLSADSGDYMEMTTDYGDGFVETYSIRFHTNFPSPEHYYTMPGHLDVYFDLYCAYNLASVVLDVYVVYPINETTATPTNAEPGGTNSLDLWLDDGTDVNVTVVWGDGDIDHEVQANYTDLTTTLTHVYASADPVTLTVMVYITNALSEHIHNLTMGTDLHIVDLVVTVSNTNINLGTTVTFTNVRTQGTQVQCYRDYGDGTTETAYEGSLPLTFTSAHQYNDLGDHHYNYTCWNHLDNVTHLGTVFLNEAITGVVPSVVAGGAYPLEDDSNFTVSWTFSTGEPAYFNASMGTIEGNDTTVTYSPKEGFAIFYEGTLVPGEYLFKLTAQNSHDPVSIEFEVSMDRPVVGTTFGMAIIDVHYVAVGRVTYVIVTQTDGSRVTDFLLLDGEVYWNTTASDLVGGADERNHSVWFLAPRACHVVSLASGNSLGNVTAVNTFSVIAVVALDNVTLEVSCPCVGSKEVTFSLVLSGIYYGTTTAVLDGSYGDGTTVTALPVNITGSGTEGAVTFTHLYPSTIPYYANFTVTNPVSELIYINLLVDVAEDVTELNVSIPASSVHGDVTPFGVEAASGTDVTVTCSFGDDTADYVRTYATATEIETPINHTYAAIGDYNVTITVANSKFIYVQNRIVQVDKAIEGYGRTGSNAESNNANWVNVTTTHGSRMDLFVDPDVEGGDGHVYDLCIDSSPSDTQIDHIYPVAGVYLVRVSLTNSVGQVQDTFIMAANKPVTARVEGPTGVNWTDLAVFNVTILTGSHVTCNVQYGDDNVELTYEDEPAAFTVFDHNYTEIAVYEFKTSCYNYISEQSETWLVYVQEPMEGYMSHPDTTYETGPPVIFNLNITGGTNVTVNVTCEPFRPDISTFVTWDGLHGQLEIPYPFHGFGHHDVTITIGNEVSIIENVFQLWVEEVVGNVVLSTEQYVAAGTDSVLTMTADTGTNVCVGVDFDDGTDQVKFTAGNVTETCTVDAGFLRVRCGEADITQADCEAIPCCYDAAEPTVKCFMPDVTTGAWSLVAIHTYIVGGVTHQIGASFDNFVNSAYRVVNVFVQYPVEHISILDISSFRNYTIGIHLSIDPPPTDAFMDIDWGDGTDNDTGIPVTVTLGSDQLVEHTLAQDAVFTAVITICNNVSCLVLQHILSPEAAFVNPSLLLSPPQRPTTMGGDAHNLTLTFDAGLSGVLYCTWGDGSPGEVFIIKNIDLIPLMSHTYAAIGSYKVTCVLNNTLSSHEFVHIADVDIDITGVGLSYSPICVPPSAAPYPETVYAITAATGSRFNILLYDSDDNVAYQATNDTADLMSVTWTYAGDPPTLFSGKLEVFNSRTLVEEFFTLAIQPRIENVMVEIANEAVEHGVEPVNFTVTGDGLVTANVTYILGNGDTNETILTSDGHNFSHMYPQDGTFNVSVYVTNYCDSVEINKTVHVEVIINVECEADFSFELSGSLIVNFKWTGTNGQVLAYLNGVEVTTELDYWSKSGNVTLPESDLQIGTQNVTFNVSNHISSAECTVKVDVDLMLEDAELSTSVMYTPVGVPFTLTVCVSNGTRFTAFCDYGDSTNGTIDGTALVVSEKHIVSTDNIYTSHGYRYITVMVSNSLTILFRSIFIGAEVAIDKTELILILPSVVDRPNTLFTCRLQKQVTLTDPPTATIMSIDWGDGNQTDVDPADLVNNPRIDRYHQFATYYTSLTFTVVLQNNVSNATWIKPTQVGRNISGLSLTADSYYKKVDELVGFVLHIDVGSRVMYTQDMGDASPDLVLVRDDPGSWQTADDQSTNHTYNQSGLFTVTLTANNSFGSVTVSQSVKVEYCILGTEILPIPPIGNPPGVVQFTIRVADDQYMSPTDVTCDFNYGNGETDRVTAVFGVEKKFQHTHTYSQNTPPDYYNATVNCSNNVCSADYETTVLLIEPIANITIDIINIYVPVLEFANATVKVDNGSHLNVRVDYGDGSPKMDYTVTTPPVVLHLSHIYTINGNRTLIINASNALESRTTVSAVAFIVQYPVPELIIISNTPVEFDITPAQFSIDIDPSSTGPTDVFCRWIFIVGEPEKETFTNSLRNGVTHDVEETYLYSHIGLQTVTVNCSNYISWRLDSFVIEIAEAIKGFSVDVSHTHGEVGVTVTFTFSVTHGSNVTATIEFGNGGTDSAAYPTLIAKDSTVVFTQTYTAEGFFQPVFTVGNSLGEFDLPDAAEVVIEYPLLPSGVLLSAQDVDSYLIAVPFKAQLIQADAPSNVIIEWTYGNGVVAEESLIFTNDEYLSEYNYVEDNWYNASARMYNNISETLLNLTPNLQVGVRITGLSISNTIPDVAANVSYAVFNVSVETGSEVEYTLTFGNGETTPPQRRHDNGWRNRDETTIEFMFILPGDPSVEVTARNVFDEITVVLDHNMNIEYMIDTEPIISPLDTQEVPSDVTFIIENKQNIPAPTDAVCDYNYGDGQEDIAVAMVSDSQNRFVIVHNYHDILPGLRTIKVNCSNKVSSQEYEITIMLHERIATVTAGIVQRWIPTNTNGEIWTLIIKGSHVSYQIDYGDGSSLFVSFMEHPPKGTETVNFEHVYTAPNNYTITISLSNDISAESVVMAYKIVVQNRLSSLYTTSPLVVAYPAGAMYNLTIDANKNNPPTDVFCRFRFYSGQQLVENYTGNTLGDGKPHIQHYSYPRERLGPHFVFVNCSNYVQFIFKSIKIWVDETITGFGVTNSTSFVKTGDSVTWTYSVKNGTSVDAFLTVGDVYVSVKETWPQFNASLVTVQFVKFFETPANHTVYHRVTNNISTAMISPEDKLVVQDPVPVVEVSIVGAPLHIVPTGDVEFEVTPESDSSPGTDVFVNWKSAYEEWTTYAHNLGINVAHKETHGFPSPGDVRITVMAINKVSNYTTSVLVHVEKVIEEPYIEILDESVLVDEPAYFTLGVRNGSHLHFEVDYKDGSAPETFIDQDELSGTSPLTISHVFTSGGNYSVSMTAYNNVSAVTKTASQQIIVQCDIMNLTISGDPYVAVDIPAVTDAKFKVALPSDACLGQNLHLNWTVNNVGLYTYVDLFDAGNTHDLSYGFNGSVLGPVTITVNAGNLVSQDIAYMTTIVQLKIKNPQINVTSITAALDTPVVFYVWVDIGSDIHYTISFGDGIMESSLQPDHASVAMFQHAYSSPGNYTANVTVCNNVNCEQAKLPDLVIVQVAIDIDDVTLVIGDCFPNPPGRITWELRLLDGAPQPSDVHMTVNYDDGTIQTVYVSGFPVTSTYKYSSNPNDMQLGDKLLVLNLTNLVSRGSIVKTICLQERVKIKDLELPEFTMVNVPTLITVILETGSHYDLQIMFGDGNSRDEKVERNYRVEFNVTYNEASLYTISIASRNNINADSYVKADAIEAQYPVDNIQLDVNSLVKLGWAGNPDQVANFTLRKTPGAPIPSNTTIITDPGDGSSPFSEEKLIAPSYTSTHTYREDGNKSGTLTVFNGVSSVKLNFTVQVQTEVTGCDFTTKKTNGQQFEEGKIPVQTLANLEATIDSGTDVTYKWILEPGVTKITHVKKLPYSFQQIGFPNVQLECFNLVSKDTVGHITEIFSPIGIQALEFEQVVEVNTNVTFTIYLAEALQAVCFSYRFKSLLSSFTFWRGQLDVCRTDATFKDEMHLPVDMVSDDGLEYTIVRIFPAIAEYNATFTAFNEFASVSRTLPFSVRAIPCNGPTIEAKEGATINTTLRYKRAEEFAISTSQFRVVKRCKATDMYVTSLQVYFYRLTDTGGEWVRHNIINPLGEGENVRSFFFERKIMGYGQYYLLYTLQPKGFPENSNSSKIYFRIEGTLMTASINNVSREKVGTMRIHKLHVFAVDPDEDLRPFGYEYYCIKKVNIWLNETFEDTIHRLDQRELVTVPTGTPTELPPEDLIGCWGQPAGRLALDARTFSIEYNTGWMPHSKDYVFLVLVSKGERRVVTTLDVIVSQGTPPEINTQCYEAGGNCKQNAMKIDNTKDLVLTFSCDNCLDNTVPTYRTTFKRNGEPYPSGEEKLKKSKTFLLEDGKTTLWSQQMDDFTNPGYYELEIVIEVFGFPDGLSAFSFAVNRKPHSCQITVKAPPDSPTPTGEEFVPRPWTPLVVLVYGCKDDGDGVETVDLDNKEVPTRRRRQAEPEETYEENHPDLKFTYSYVKKGKEIPFFGDTVLLPEGHKSEDYMIQLIVVATDNYGGKEIFSTLIKVEEQVYDDPEEAAAAEAEKEELLDSIISTDLSQTTDVVGALSNIITAISETGNEPEAGSGAEAPDAGSDEAKDAAEAARLEEIKRQDRLATVMTGLVNLATSDASDPDTIKATFEAYAVIVKQQSGAASSSMKSDSLDIAASFLDNIDQQEDKDEFLNSFVDTMGDALGGALAIAPPPPPEEEDDVPSEDDDDSDDAAAAAAKLAEEAALAKKAAQNLQSSADSIVGALRTDVLLDAAPLTVGDTQLSVTVAMTSLSRVNGSILTTGGSEVTFPALFPDGNDDAYAVFFQVTYTEVNVFSWTEASKQITDGVTILDFFDSNNNPLEFVQPLEQPLKIDMEQTAALDNWANMDNLTVDQESNLIYMYVPVDVAKSAFIMELDLNTFDDASDIYFEVYFKFGATDAIMDRPNMTKGSYDLIREVPDRKNPFPWVVIIAEAQIQLPGIYVGIIPKVRNSTKLFNQTTVPPFNMRSSLPRCRSWDMVEEDWSGKSCEVGHDSSIDNTRCKCGELNRAVRTYSGGLSVPKVNTIDFSKVFANFSDLLAANPTVLATILVIFILYLLLLIWARRADQKDMEKWCVTPLVDNPLHCPHLYKVSVYTGLRQGAGTHSKVCFIVSGDKGDTGVRVLDDGRGKNFERATLRHFLMTTEQPLGELTFLRVWHDNSGQGPAASWFLDKIVVEDILGRTRYFFLNGHWLAVDEEDGQVDRLLPTAAHEEIDGFNHVFFSQARHNLTDDHLWISVLSRPTKSSFTRSQRLTCCLALLCTTMVANAMFYGSAEAVEEDQVIRIGPIILSVAVLLVSIFSSLTIIPVNILIVQLFRKSRPRGSTELPDGSELRTTEMGEKDVAYMRRYSIAEKNAGSEPVGEGEGEKKEDEENKKSKKKKPRKYWFPWWGIVVAWVVALLASVGSLFFVLLYSLQWGKIKSEEWLSSLLLSFFQSVIVIQPVKVVIVAMMMSIVFKKFKDEEEEIPLNPTTGPGSEDYDEILHIDRKMFTHVPTMPNKRKLEKARRQRELDRKLMGLLIEIMSYFFFLLLIAFIAFGSFDIQRYQHTSHLRRLLNGAKKNETLQRVTDRTKMWRWLDVTAADVLYNVRDYTNTLTSRSSRRYLKDNTNVRVGAVRLRQVRVKPALCDVPDVARGIVLECNTPYDVTREQKANFSTYWLDLPVNHTDAVTELQEAFRYKDIMELKSSLTIGRQALYNGGGYVANLGTSPNKARRVMKDLKDAFWVDYYTRAIFLEFTVYNANANLFGFVQYVFEIPASGGIIPMTFVSSFHVYTVFSVMGTVVVVCQILYILILLYIIVREIRKLRKETSEVYFRNPWNIYEVVVIVASCVGIGMYGAGEAAGRLVTKDLSEDKEGYTYYERLASYTDVLTVVIGFIVFLSNIRFMRLLRLNRHIVDLYHTLRNARKELLYFSVTFFIIFSSFSLPAVIFFGTWMYGFSDIFRSVSGTFNILLGRLHWHDMMTANPIMTPIYFFILVVLVYFILINMFVSILTSSYQLVRLNPDREKESEYKVMAFLSAKLSAAFCCCCPTHKQPETGKDYLDNLDTLDDRVNHINDMINNYYRENIKSKYLESKPKTMETKGDMNDPMSKKKMFADMMHF